MKEVALLQSKETPYCPFGLHVMSYCCGQGLWQELLF